MISRPFSKVFNKEMVLKNNESIKRLAPYSLQPLVDKLMSTAVPLDLQYKHFDKVVLTDSELNRVLSVVIDKDEIILAVDKLTYEKGICENMVKHETAHLLQLSIEATDEELGRFILTNFDEYTTMEADADTIAVTFLGASTKPLLDLLKESLQTAPQDSVIPKFLQTRIKNLEEISYTIGA